MSMLKHHKDPGRFNPALRNREVVLDPAHVKALIKDHAPEKVAGIVADLVATLRAHVSVLGTALEESNLAAAGESVVLLAAFAANAGARQLERDGCLIQASLNAGRPERARRLWHRLHCGIAALDEAMGQFIAALERDGSDPDAQSTQQ
jgi:hypothetical protein